MFSASFRLPRILSGRTVLFAALAAGALALAQPPVTPNAALERQLDGLLARLSLEEKIDLLGGVNRMFIREVPSIGLPKLKMTDSPMGVVNWGPSTAYAAGIGLAASWDPELARAVGESIGRDARARGVHFLLGPGVNLQRTPKNGRNFEYFGEDPWLASRITVDYIRGVQSQGVVATVKHFAGNNSESDRRRVSSDIDERSLRELYFPAFEAAVKEADVGAVMTSYNRVNGTFAAHASWLNRDLLKGEWGFSGILMSDWHAAHDGVEAANGGLDLEMPSGAFMNRDSLLPAIKAGTVVPALVDDKVRRILRTATRFGFLDRPQLDPNIPLYSTSARAVALRGAEEGIVLLKNEAALLPLDPKKLKTIAVIGPNAWPALYSGGGSARLHETFTSTSFLTGIADFLGSSVRVLYAPGLPTPVEVMRRTAFDPANGKPGLEMQVFDNPDFEGEPRQTSWVPFANLYQCDPETASPARPTGVRWIGRFTPKKTGPYLLLVGAGNRDAYTLYLDDRPLVTQPSSEGQALAYRTVQLTAGKTISLRLDYVQEFDQITAGFGLVPMDELVSDEAKHMASVADAAVVCVGFDPSSEAEAVDRTFELPGGQDALIQVIASANPRTIVTLHSGGGVDMEPWLARVPALLQTWYPGQEGGTALAEILFGARSPEGKLPTTFDRAWKENPAHDHYDLVIDPNTDDLPHVAYAEGLFIGYRYYTSKDKSPLFPFGFGLSYTTFEFSHLKVPSSGSAAVGMDVRFDVTNTGPREGTEVAQLYVGDPSAKVSRPARELKAFQKVRLKPGEKRHVTLHLNARSFAYWNVTAHQWQVDPGVFTIQVGNSSVNVPLVAQTLVRP